MSLKFREIGDRLRAYRLGSGLSAEEVAEKLGVSRAAVYRIEAGEVIKIQTLERLANVIGASTASLLGVDIECYSSAVGYFERMRQLETDAEQVISHFQPFSFLLTSDRYIGHLRQMLVESLPEGPQAEKGKREISNLLAILEERKKAHHRRRLSVVNLVAVAEIERLLTLGLVGRLNLPPKVIEQRRHAARAEVEHLLQTISSEPMGTQIGLIEGTTPSLTFQIFRRVAGTTLAISPFRLGEQPNVLNGVAMLTVSAEPVRLYEELAENLWQHAIRGPAAAAVLRKLLQRADNQPAQRRGRRTKTDRNGARPPQWT